MKKGLRVLLTANMKLSFFCVVFFSVLSFSSFGQTFLENMGTPAGTTAISANTFQNSGTFTYTGTADVRATTVSTGYTGASGGGNVFITNTSGINFQIAGINTSSLTSLGLSFGIFKSTTTGTGSDLIVEYSTDGVGYTTLAYPALTTGTGTAIWFLRTVTTAIPSTANLRIRFRQTGTATQYRIDDVKLTGTVSGPTVPSCVASPTSPANAATNISTAGTTLTWANPGGATSYDVYFGTDAAATNIVNGLNQLDPTVTYATGALLSSTTYFWKIVPRNATGAATGPCTIWSFTTAAAPPANDACANAVTITPGTTCNNTAGTTVAATQQFNPTTCDGSTSSSANDVWYSFTADGTSSYKIKAATNGGISDLVVGLYSSCSSGSLIICADGVTTGTEIINAGVLSAGTYLYRIYGYNGASGTFNTCVTTLSLSETHVDVTCNGASTGSINLTVTGGTSPYTFSWNSGAFTTQNLTAKPAGTYTVLVTDADGSTATKSVTLTQPAALAAPTISADGPLTFCSPGSVTLTSSVATGNTWSTGSTNQAITVSTSGTYSVSYVSGGCTSPSASAIVTVNTYGGAVTLLNEAVATPSGAPLALVNSYTGWTSASPITFSSTDGVTDVRTTSASSGYSGASGTANVFMGISGTINRNLTIAGINTTGVSALSLSFGLLRDNTTNGITVEVSADGSTYTSLSITQPASANTWTLVTATGTIPQTSNLRIRFSKNNNTSFRLDDIKLTGANSSASISQANGCGSTVTLTASQGSSYSWSTLATSQSISVGSTGTYSVTITSNGCTSSASADVNALPTPLSASTNEPTPVTCNGGTNGSVTISAFNGTPPYTGAGTITGLSAGTYNFTVTDVNGCTTTVTGIEVTQPTAIEATAAVTPPACFGGNGNVQISASGGTGSLTNTGAHSVAAGAAYSFTVTDANSCSSNVISGTMAAPTQVVASSSFTPILCNGGSTTVTVSATGGTGSYGATVGTFTASAGAYSYTVTDGNGCSATTTGTITQPSAIVTTETHTNVSCFGGNNGAIDLTVSGGTPINAPVFTSAVETFNSLASTGTSSTVPSGWAFSESGSNANTTYTAGNGSSSTGDTYSFGAALSSERAFGGLLSGSLSPFIGLQITNTSSSTVTSVDISYFGEQWRLGNTGRNDRLDFQYSLNATSLTTGTWTDANSLDYVAPVSTGTTGALDGNANRISVSGTISGLSIAPGGKIWIGWRDFDATGADDGLAIDDFSYVLNAPSAYTYLWSNTATTQDISTLTAATYSVTVKDGNNCEATKSVVVTEPSQLVATATITQTACHGAPATVVVSASGGTSPYFGTGTFSLADGTGTTYTVSDNNACPATSNFVAALSPSLLVATATITQAACHGDPATVIVTATGGTGSYTGTGTFSLADGASASYVVSDENSCLATSNLVTASSPSQVVATATITQAACYGEPASVVVTATGGTGAYTGTGTFSLTDGESASYVVSDENSCSAASNSVTASSPSQVVASATITQALCHGDAASVVVTATGGTGSYTGTGTFSLADGASASYVVNDANSCSATSNSVTASSPSQVVATATITQALCYGDPASVEVTATGGTGSYTGTGTFSLADGASASYVVSDANSCSATSNSVTASSPSQVVATATITQALCHGDPASVEVTATGGTGSYTGTGTFSLADGASGSYVVSDANSCSATSNSVTASSPSQVVTTATITQALCHGDPASVEVIATGGTGSYTGTGTFSLADGASASYVVSDANSCSATSNSVTASSPAAIPAPTGSATQSFCSSLNPKVADLVATGSNLQWYATIGDVTPLNPGTTGLVDGAHYFATQTVGTCESPTRLDVAVSLSAAPELYSGCDATICSGSSWSIDCSTTSNYGSISWSTTGDGSFNNVNALYPVYTPGSNDISSGHVDISRQLYGTEACSAVSYSTGFNLYITDCIFITGTTTSTICPGTSLGAVDISVSGGGMAPYTYNWSNGATTEDITGLAAGVYTVTVTDINSATGSASFTVGTFIPAAKPATPGTITGASLVCVGSSYTYSIAPIANTVSYIWTVPATAVIVSGQGTTSVVVQFISSSTSYTFNVAAVNCIGTSTPKNIIVTKILAPGTPGAITGTTPVCVGNTYTYSIAPVTNATSYTWTAPANTTIISGQGTTSITLAIGNAYVTSPLSVYASNCSGNSAAWQLSIVKLAAPATPGAITGPTVVCTGNSYTYSIAAVGSASSYTWTAPANSTITSGQGTTSITLQIDNGYSTTGNLSVIASNCNYSSGARTLAIAKTAIPATPGAVTGPVMVCPGTQTYSIAAVANATSYTWTAPANATIASGQGTTTVSITYLSGFVSGNISVVAINCSGASAVPKTLAVGLTAATPSITGPVNGVCGNTSQSYSVATVSGATGYEWSVTGATSFTGQGASSITVTFPASYSTVTIKVRATTSCSVAAWSTTITVRSVPAVPGTITGLTPVCAGTTQTYSIAAITGATGYSWTLPGGTWTYVSGQGTISYTVIAGTVAGSIKVNASNACGSSVDATKSIAIATSGCGAAGKTDETESLITENNANTSFNVSVYPNPFADQFRLNIVGSSDEKLEVRVFDVLGQLIQQTTKIAYQSDITFGSTLSKGVYLLEVTQGVNTKVIRIVKSE